MTMGEIASLTLCLPSNPFIEDHVKLFTGAISFFHMRIPVSGVYVLVCEILCECVRHESNIQHQL